MSAFFTSDQIAALSATTVRCEHALMDFDFLSGPYHAWNGNTELVAGGKTYRPMYGFAQADGLGAVGPGTTSQAITLALDGLPDMPLDYLAKVLADTSEVDQRVVTLSLQLFDDDWQTVGSPIAHYRGFLQPPKVSRTEMAGGEGAAQSVSVQAENIFYGRARPPYGRNTDRDQQSRSLGDKFFGFVSSLLYKIIVYPDY